MYYLYFILKKKINMKNNIKYFRLIIFYLCVTHNLVFIIQYYIILNNAIDY